MKKYLLNCEIYILCLRGVGVNYKEYLKKAFKVMSHKQCDLDTLKGLRVS